MLRLVMMMFARNNCTYCEGDAKYTQYAKCTEYAEYAKCTEYAEYAKCTEYAKYANMMLAII